MGKTYDLEYGLKLEAWKKRQEEIQKRLKKFNVLYLASGNFKAILTIPELVRDDRILYSINVKIDEAERIVEALEKAETKRITIVNHLEEERFKVMAGKL